MSDKDLKKLKQENDQLKEELKNKSAQPEDYFQPYKCTKCQTPVNFMFIMPVIKASGMCPNCFHGD